MHQESKDSPSSRRIVVVGDTAVDWLQWTCTPNQSDPDQNWQMGPIFRMIARPGGSLLLARMMASSTGAKVMGHSPGELSDISSYKMVHSMVEVGTMPPTNLSDSPEERVYRVERFKGYSGPAKGVIAPQPVDQGIVDAEMIVLDDAGNGFRDHPEIWERLLEMDTEPMMILKMNRPLAQGDLWDALLEKHGDRLVTVVNANTLRLHGMNISRRLSWERTAQDFDWHSRSNPILSRLMRSRYLVVLFGIEGAIVSVDREEGRNVLYYDPMVMEDDYKDDWPGQMQGLTSAFVAGLASRVFKDGVDSIGDGVKEGLASARRLFIFGYGVPPNEPDYPMERLFVAHDSDPLFNVIDVPRIDGMGKIWTILDEVAGDELEEVAHKMVVEGTVSPFIRVPVARFGAMRTVDRTEIESYKSIMNLLDEYLSKRDATTPLSIAVFGQPGSGKTYGVTQISRSLQPEKIEKLEFNVSQFQSPDDLINAFHHVQSTALMGKIPLVFFDEFDCFFGQRKGWLKYFLAPMQDGVFRDKETFHPIGKSIFVFAGGTSHTFDDFFSEYSDDSRFNDEQEAREAWEEWEEFCEAKGPDFVSRLRGYVNIMGINPMGGDDRCFMIRRAMILRSILEDKASHIFDEDGRALIDPGVLNALIRVSRYKHGVRSMEAVIDMSLLSDRPEFEQTALPPRDQLELHVDAEDFLRLVRRSGWASIDKLDSG